MSIFTTNYSPLVTCGLGGTACQTLILAKFGLTGITEVIIVVPPSGGGPVNVGGFYVPLPRKMTQQTRMVLITIKLSEQHVWRRSYVVDVMNADKIVRVMNFVDSIKNKLMIGVEHMKYVGKRVVAVFKKDK